MHRRLNDVPARLGLDVLLLGALLAVWLGSVKRAAAQEAVEAEAESAPDPGAPPPGISVEARAAVEQGVKFLEQKRYQEATRALLAAARRHPTNGQFRHLLGVSYAHNKQLGRAWVQFRKSVRFNPGYQPAVRDFLTLWENFRRQGLFNVGQTPQNLQGALGQPDAQRNASEQLLWEYGFMRIHFANDKLVSIVDPRGLDAAATNPQDAVRLKFDSRSWKLGFRAINRLQSLAEYVPADQSVQDWQELVTVQRLYGMTQRNVSPQQMMGQIRKSLEETSPGSVFQVLASGDQDVTFQWQNDPPGAEPPQHEIVRLIAGQRDILRLAYAKKVPQLSPEDAQQWRDILQQAELQER